ncbi:MAG: tetratricopeptide repeat protein [Chloroflexota bacterium]
MTELTIQLFGSPIILHNQEPVTGFISSKATALVYYLAATHRTQSRELLATLFWGDVPDSRAKKNLRDILSNLRKVMGPYLEITRQTVALTIPTEAIDVCQFEALLSATQDDNSSQQGLASLKSAAALQRGEFLEGFRVSDAPNFDDWMSSEQSRLEQLILQMLNQLTAEAMQQGNHIEGIDYAVRSLALNPLEESTYRHLMAMYAATGQYAAALERYDQCSQMLYEDFGREPSAETIDLFENIQIRQESPEPQQIDDDHLQPFVGRSEELAEINRLLSSSDCRLLTLVGLGGVGKSRLARQAAMQNAHRFLDGTYLIEVGPQESLEQFVTDIAVEIGLSISVDEDAISQLLDYLRAKSMLLIIDNAEVLLQSPEMLVAADQRPPSHYRTHDSETTPLDLLGMIVGASPNVTLIVTSREHLGLRSEWIFEVGGLSTPISTENRTTNRTVPGETPLAHVDDSGEFAHLGPSDVHPASDKPTSEPADFDLPDSLVSGLLHSDAVQLFLKRGRQAWAEFPQEDTELSPGDLIAIGRICQLVDGMPLAIELAAGWVSMLSCREIMREVMKGVELLESTARDRPERHRSLQAIFDHAWQILSPAEQTILEKLAIFQGGFSRKAAQEITGATLPELQNLLQHSFLARSGKERFDLHNLLQQYALNRLSENPQTYRATREQHARYFSQILVRHQQAIQVEQIEVLSILTVQEIDNLRGAFDWAIENGQFDILAQMLDGLFHIYTFRSWFAEGVARFYRALKSLYHRQLGRDGGSNLTEQEATHEAEQKEQAVLSRLQIRLGRLFQMLGRHDEAQRHLTEGWVWADRLGDPLEQALCLLGQANVHYELADYAAAEEAGQQSLAIYQSVQSRSGAAHTLYCLGNIWLAKGEYTQARENLTQALALTQAIHLRSTEAECLGVLGQVCWNQGDLAAARRYFEEALEIFRLPQITNLLSEGKLLNQLGFVAWSQGLVEQAQTYHTQARHIFRRIGNRQGEGNTLSHLGRVAERHKEFEKAARLYEQALLINQEIQDRQGEAVSNANLAFAAFRRANYPLSARYFTECRDLCSTIGFRRYEALAVACLGLLTCFHSDYLAGADQAEASLDIAQQIQDPIMEAYGWLVLGYAHSGLAQWEKAFRAFERCLSLRRESGEVERLLDPLAGLAFVALQRNTFETAYEYTAQIISGLNDLTEAAAMLPAQVYYVCHVCLAQRGDPAAETYLQRTKGLLEAYRPVEVETGEIYKKEVLIFDTVLSTEASR